MSGFGAVRRAVSLDGQLSLRDTAVIAALAELRFLSARQIERWHFSGPTPLARARAARRALQRLTELGVLTRLERRIGGVRAGSAGYVYALDLYGQQIAETCGWLRQKRTRRLREPSRTFLRHTLAVAELHVRMIETDRAGTWELVERQGEPACWRGYVGSGGGHQVLKPDTFAAVAVDDGEVELSWFVEIDCDTQSATRIERKLAAYVAYWRSGREIAHRGVQPRTLWLAPTARRATQLHATIQRLPEARQPLFAVAVFDEAIPVLGGANL